MKEHQNLFRDLQEDFRKMKKNLLVAQSGGPTAAINATLAGVIKQAIKEEQTLLTYGVLACLKGLKEQGCDGPVTTAINQIEKYINKQAHK